MAGIGLSGLASGVDTSTVIEQLMAVDRQQVTRMQLRQSVVQTGNAQLKDLQTKMTSLKSAATDLASVATWGSVQATTSSDTSRVQVTRTGGAPIGGYSLSVSRLASAAQQTFAWTPSASASTLDLGYTAGGTPVTVNIAANATAADVAATLNGAVDAPVYAAVVNGNQLVLSSRKTGVSGGFSATGAGLGSPVAQVAGEPARYSLNGGPEKTSDANVIEAEIPGLRIALKGVTAAPVSITVDPPAPDTEKVKAKVQAFVDAYNSLVTATSARTSEKSVKDATNTSDASKGRFFGDSGLTSMLSQLRRGMSDAFSTVGNPAALNELSEMGISTGRSTGSVSADATLGKLSINAEKLTEALSTDPVSVRRMLGGVAGAGGLAQRVGDMVTKTFAPMFTNRIATADRSATEFDQRIAATTKRLDAQEVRLKAQFAAMESAIQSSNTQSSWLSGQIASLGS